MNNEPDERYYKKLKAAYLIYKENYTQQMVADLLNVSRPTVSKLLDEAMKEGIVSIEVNDVRNMQVLFEREMALKKKYNLMDVRVIDCIDNKYESIVSCIAKAGAAYFESLLKSHMSIGISWGVTLESLVSNLRGNRAIKDLQVVSIVGGHLFMDSKYHANTLAQRILDKYDGVGQFLYAPSVFDDEKEYDSFMKNSQIKATLELAKEVDVALVSVGGVWTQVKPEIRVDLTDVAGVDIAQDQIAGGINAELLDYNGQLVDISASRLSLGLKANELKDIKRVIAVAGGPEKHAAIKAILTGGYINTLITDTYTAAYLLAD